MQLYQNTIQDELLIEGEGLHTGQSCRLAIRPAPVNTGILFHKQAGDAEIQIPAIATNVVSTSFATTLGLDDSPEMSISTVEHLMAAIQGLGIDNLYCYVSGPEIPMLDGCSQRFVECLGEIGILAQDEFKKVLRIKETVCCADGDAWAILKPHDSFRLNVQIDYEHSSFQDPMVCHASFDNAEHSFIDEISQARTFGFRRDYLDLLEAGYAQGIKEKSSAVLIYEKHCLAEGAELRYPNEAARHKILDALGDLALTGFGSILGSYTGYKAGHTLNNRLARKLLAQPHCFEETYLSDLN